MKQLNKAARSASNKHEKIRITNDFTAENPRQNQVWNALTLSFHHPKRTPKPNQQATSVAF
ncbi:hypothetical protein ACXHWJ_14305 [Alcaligenes nematophilus]